MRRVPGLTLAAVLLGLTTAGCSAAQSGSPTQSSVAPSSVAAADIPTDSYKAGDPDCALVSPTQIEQIAGDVGYSIKGEFDGCKIIVGESSIDVTSFELPPPESRRASSEPVIPPGPGEGAIPALGPDARYSSWGAIVSFTRGTRQYVIALGLKGSTAFDSRRTVVAQKDLDAAVLLGKTVIARTQG